MEGLELMWLAYAVENLTYDGNFFNGVVGFIVGTTALTAVLCIPFVAMKSADAHRLGLAMGEVVSYWKKYYPLKSVIALIIVMMTLHTILPTRETAIKMAGAYLLQQVVTDDKTKALGNAAYNAAMRQLTKWGEEVPDLADMMLDASTEAVKDKIVGDKCNDQ
jgi:hypothetical protein